MKLKDFSQTVKLNVAHGYLWACFRYALCVLSIDELTLVKVKPL